jgi:hypothetical protein
LLTGIGSALCYTLQPAGVVNAIAVHRWRCKRGSG